MSKVLIFFCCACCILLLTIINLSIGPVISGKLDGFGTMNCARIKDLYDSNKDNGVEGDELKYGYKWYVENCQRSKGMYDMEYTSFIFDVAIGLVCGLLGLLHFWEVKKDFVSKTGLIGLCCGIVGFILTFVYVILNGLVYTKSHTGIYKMDGDLAFAELKGDKYECYYFDKKYNDHALMAKYCDLNKKQYNYDKDLIKKYETAEVAGCGNNPSICEHADNGYLEKVQVPRQKYSTDNTANIECKYLYYRPNLNSRDVWLNDYTNKDISDRFLTVLILSLLVCLANIGLALFGFLLFKNKDDL